MPFGDYTAFSSHFLEADKGYYTRIAFGKSTDSGDRDGNIVEEWSIAKVSEFYQRHKDEIIKEVLGIKDWKSQTPPVISAIKVGGVRQSSLFRTGIAFDSVSRPIEVKELEYFNLSETGIELNLKVTSGTYIRKIAIDLGEKLNLPMYLEKLVRTSIGSHNLSIALSLEEILFPDAKFFDLEEMISYPTLSLNEKETKAVRHGGYIKNNLEGNFLLRDNDGNLLAWCTTEEKKSHLPYKYMKVFYNPDEN